MALAIQMASIAEASAVGRRLGLDPKVLADVFNSSSARCWSSDTYNPVPVCSSSSSDLCELNCSVPHHCALHADLCTLPIRDLCFPYSLFGRV